MERPVGKRTLSFHPNGHISCRAKWDPGRLRCRTTSGSYAARTRKQCCFYCNHYTNCLANKTKPKDILQNSELQGAATVAAAAAVISAKKKMTSKTCDILLYRCHCHQHQEQQTPNREQHDFRRIFSIIVIIIIAIYIIIITLTINVIISSTRS